MSGYTTAFCIKQLEYEIPPPMLCHQKLNHPTTGIPSPPCVSQKIRVHFSLTVFFKYDQLDSLKASDKISDYLTSIIPKHFWII